MKKIVKTLLVLLVGLGILGSSVQVAFASQPSSNYSEGEVAGEYVSSAQEFTSIDEDGTYHPLSEDELTLDSDRSNFSNGIMQLYYNPDIDYATGVVNFRTKSSALYNTEYTEDGTGIAGYTNGYYGADAAFLGYSGDMTQVKFMLSGVTGLSLIHIFFQKEQEHKSQAAKYQQIAAERDRLQQAVEKKRNQALKMEHKAKRDSKKNSTKNGGRLAHQKSIGSKEKTLYNLSLIHI